MSTPRDIEKDPDFEHFLVRSKMDIISVLQALAQRKAELGVHVEGIAGTLHTRLISVRPEYEELVFDAAGLHGLDRLDGTQRLEADGMLDVARVVFTAAHVETTLYEGKPAFRGRIPGAIARIQRRGSVRYPVPSLNPPVCSTSLGGRVRALRVMDISLGGVAVALEEPQLALEPGTRLASCRIEIPGTGSLESDLIVTHINEINPQAPGGWRRVGCRFDAIDLQALEHVRRYVARLERERLPRP
jgi:c-di-GMP-binding flagellar brake protein YcgR